MVAISFGMPMRRSGVSLPICTSRPSSFSLAMVGRVMPVSMMPGHTALTRTPVPASE